MSASFGETTCTRADPGPDVTRWTTQCAGTMTPTRPSTNSVIGMPAADGRTSSSRLRIHRRATAADSSAPANTAVARPPRLVGGRATGARASSSDGSVLDAASHPISIADRDGNTVGPQAISDRCGEPTDPLDTLGTVHHNRYRRRNLRQDRVGVSMRHHLDVASGQRHNNELRRYLHYRQRSIRQSVAQRLRPSQHHNVVRHRARGIAHTVHARRCPPRRTNERDRIGRAADDIVHNGSPHVRDG